MFGWKSKTRVERTYEVVSEPTPVDDDSTEQWSLEMSLSTRELAGIYTSKGWTVSGTQGENPSRSELLLIIGRLAAHLTEHGDCSYSTTARLMAVKDEDFPDNVDFYLYIGTASPKIVDHETQGV